LLVALTLAITHNKDLYVNIHSLAEAACKRKEEGEEAGLDRWRYKSMEQMLQHPFLIISNASTQVELVAKVSEIHGRSAQGRCTQQHRTAHERNNVIFDERFAAQGKSHRHRRSMREEESKNRDISVCACDSSMRLFISPKQVKEIDQAPLL